MMRQIRGLSGVGIFLLVRVTDLSSQENPEGNSGECSTQ